MCWEICTEDTNFNFNQAVFFLVHVLYHLSLDFDFRYCFKTKIKIKIAVTKISLVMKTKGKKLSLSYEQLSSVVIVLLNELVSI